MNDTFSFYLKKAYHRIRNIYELKKTISGKNNLLFLKKSILRNAHIDISGNNNTIEISDGAILENIYIQIHGDNHTLIVKNGTWINASRLFFEDQGCKISIHEKCWINKSTLSAVENGSTIVIGPHCVLAEECDLRTSDSHAIIDTRTHARINPAAPIHLEKHVWLGKRVAVLKGVHIGAHSMVALGSIVTKDVPEHCVAAGIPAMVVRENTTWTWEK